MRKLFLLFVSFFSSLVLAASDPAFHSVTLQTSGGTLLLTNTGVTLYGNGIAIGGGGTSLTGSNGVLVSGTLVGVDGTKATFTNGIYSFFDPNGNTGSPTDKAIVISGSGAISSHYDGYQLNLYGGSNSSVQTGAELILFGGTRVDGNQLVISFRQNLSEIAHFDAGGNFIVNGNIQAGSYTGIPSLTTGTYRGVVTTGSNVGLDITANATFPTIGIGGLTLNMGGAGQVLSTTGSLSLVTTATSTVTGISLTVASGTLSLTGTATPLVAAPITLTTGTVGITQSTGTTNGYLSSTDWSSFNGKTSSQWTTTSGTNVSYTAGNVIVGGTNSASGQLQLSGTGSSWTGLTIAVTSDGTGDANGLLNIKRNGTDVFNVYNNFGNPRIVFINGNFQCDAINGFDAQLPVTLWGTNQLRLDTGFASGVVGLAPVSAALMKVTNASSGNGSIQALRHLGLGNAPSIVVNANAGTGATAAISNADDFTGTITVVAGLTPNAGTVCTGTFATAWTVAPNILVGSGNANGVVSQPYGATTSTTFSVGVATALVTGTYIYSYIVTGTGM